MDDKKVTRPGRNKAPFARNTVTELYDQGLTKPQAVEVEEAVLGALLLEKGALELVVDILAIDHFYKDENKLIYGAILALFNKNEPVDALTVGQELKAQHHFEFVGGYTGLTRLTSRVSSAANIEYHSRIVVERAMKRELIRITAEAHRDAYDPSVDVFDLLDKTETDIFQLTEGSIKKNYQDLGTVLTQALDELDKRKDQKDGLTGVGSGFVPLDRLTNGWQKSDFIIVAARPAMGKTAFALSCARNAAVQFKKPTAVFSLEMSSVQLVNRLISAEAELESEKIKKGNLQAFEWHQLSAKTAALASAPIFIDDTPALSILELRAKCRRLKAQHGIEMIIIDYLQLMTGDQSKAGNREQEIASISRSLKNLAKELNVPVIALSQLSRNVETRTGGKKPQLSDLRESGSLEQDADMVIFLYRPDYYGIKEDETGQNLEGLGEIIIAKHRNGAVDSVYLKFIGKYTKFIDQPDSMGTMGFSSALPDTGNRIPSEFDLPPTFGNGISTGLPSLPPDDSMPF
jgi:replicative DNA helicase